MKLTIRSNSIILYHSRYSKKLPINKKDRRSNPVTAESKGLVIIKKTSCKKKTPFQVLQSENYVENI